MSGKGGEKIKRFGPYRVLEHHLNMSVFSVLVLTGLSQKFHGAFWAEWFVLAVGGIDTVRLIHRYSGLLFGAFLAQHVAVAAYGVVFRKWEPSMVINKKDFSDAVENIRYYIGVSDRPARCGRYDYKQKFEYWGVVVGGVLMFFTGLTLWFPTVVFRLAPVLPGQVIPAAKVAHTNEAFLAFLVIVIWHIYNSIFSPEVFPIDTSIFTGRISKERMKHEHPLEYEKLTGEKIEEEEPEDEGDASIEGPTKGAPRV